MIVYCFLYRESLRELRARNSLNPRRIELKKA